RRAEKSAEQGSTESVPLRLLNGVVQLSKDIFAVCAVPRCGANGVANETGQRCGEWAFASDIADDHCPVVSDSEDVVEVSPHAGFRAGGPVADGEGDSLGGGKFSG